MEETRPFVSWDLVHDFMVDVFVKYGVPEEDACICTDVLLESDRRGIESHGCNRFKPIYLDRIKNGNNAMYHLGHFFFVINPSFFMGIDTFKKTAGDICRGLRNSTKAPGQERIYTAGEKEYMAWLDRKDKGVPVGESIQKEFIQLRDELGLTQYKFPFEK